jgi:hypothetical protein
MTDRDADLLVLVREKRNRIAELEAELATLKSELSAVLRELMPDPDPVPSKRGTSGGNTMKWAEEVLRENGQPLHVTDMITRIERQFGGPVRYTTLVSNMSRLVKQGRTFYRAGPNVFGLLEEREKTLKGER